ncbi:hypothetical protein BH23ACT2_BH23ACT2_27630 [soil metagenome]
MVAEPVLFPTIRFAIFFVVVLPAAWLLMPLPGRYRRAKHDRSHAWIASVGLASAAALLGPLAPTEGWSEGPRTVLWVVAGGLGVAAVAHWATLRGLTRWNVFILVASYVFYGNYSWHFVAVLAGSTVVNAVLGRVLAGADAERRRRILLGIAVAFNLGLLAWFKYRGFFAENASSILAPLGWDFEPPARAIIPPVGISFFTFQALSYVIDIYRRKLEPVPMLEFAVFLSFFPNLVAGPIVRAAEFLPQLRVPRDARHVDSGLAFWLIAVGLFKKVVVSSYLADAIVDPVFRIPSQHQAADTLLGIYGYAIQIYCDFSGYTDMAIGLALLLGFRFPPNFDAPYTAASLQDFWRRWHMTLSRWLRDYVYIPLGGNQQGPSRAYVNLFLTMFIGGLWHGAAWTFLAWGAIHGGYLVAERWWGGRSGESEPEAGDKPVDDPAPEPARVGLAGGDDVDPPHPLRDPAGATDADTFPGGPVSEARRVRPTMSPTVRLWVGRFVTFHVVCLGWVFFRAPSVSEAVAVLGRLTELGTGTGVNLMVVATIAVFLATQYVSAERVGRAQAAFSRLATWQQGGLLAGWLVITSALAPAGVAPFIYFAF